MNWFLAIWLITPSNYAVYSEFKTLQQCQEKKMQIEKALLQAESKMKVDCREISKLPQV
jgi:hypothetical protein